MVSGRKSCIPAVMHPDAPRTVIHRLGKPVCHGKFHIVVTTFARELEENPVASRTAVDVASRLGLDEADVGIWLCYD